eukprot:8301493-Lingulodinium_polyedra.AAC.1
MEHLPRLGSLLRSRLQAGPPGHCPRMRPKGRSPAPPHPSATGPRSQSESSPGSACPSPRTAPLRGRLSSAMPPRAGERLLEHQ